MIFESLNKEAILSNLSLETKKHICENIVVYETIDSTNEEAKRLLKKNQNTLFGALLLAEHQSAGKGRLGRTFYSPKSSGIYFSFIYKNHTNAKNENAPITLTIAAAVAVRRALQAFNINAKIKWVNDLYLNEKKICGILTEGVFTNSKNIQPAQIDTYIIGIGVNVVEPSEGFPTEIKHIAGSIKSNIDRNVLVAYILNNFLDILKCSNSEIIDEYREHSLVINKVVCVIKPNETYEAKVLSITDKGYLLIELQDGSIEELLSGEVSLKLV